MPSLGADMDAGTLVRWHVKPGDAVKRGNVVADVETDKGIVEVEIWDDGIVESIVVPPGTKVPVGTVLARLRATESAPIATVPRAETRPLASPAARKFARERGVDLAHVRGTGPHGAITRSDVERAGAAPFPTEAAATPEATQKAEVPKTSPNVPAPPKERPAAEGLSMRRAIAAAMSRSKREIPHYYLSTEIDVRAASRWLERENERRPVPDRILFASILLKATALAAKAIPDVNGYFVEGAFRPEEHVHLGVAISLRQGGLIAPAIHNVSERSVGEVQAALRDVVSRARAGKLRSSEMTDATLTVTNLGDQGVLGVFGVIYPPQVALVGFGRVTERPWAEGDLLGVRPILTATLSGDHRVSDGHRGAIFLSTIARFLQEPEKL